MKDKCCTTQEEQTSFHPRLPSEGFVLHDPPTANNKQNMPLYGNDNGNRCFRLNVTLLFSLDGLKRRQVKALFSSKSYATARTFETRKGSS